MQTNHTHYYQVQHQMLVANLNYYDFYVWSNWKADNAKFLVRIENVTLPCEIKMTKYAEVLDKALLPELITQKSDPKKESKAEICCI